MTSLGLGLSSVFAQVMPKGSPLDGRVQKMAYSEKDVVEIHAREGVATQIVFEEGEEILDIATGFTQGWELKKRRNHLYLKPKSIPESGDRKGLLKRPNQAWNTNLLVTTPLRNYSFELLLDEGGGKEKTAYRITFEYPLEALEKKRKQREEQAIEKKLADSPRGVNFAYTLKVRKDSLSIAPIQAFDDGRFTYVSFYPNQEFPAVFAVDADQKEQLVNTHVDPKQPNVLVIQRVWPEFRLRSGKKVVGLFNERWDFKGVFNDSGTTVPGIKRRMKLSHEVLP